MMHNSLWIRDRLRSLNLDPLHIERRDPHRAVGWDGDTRPREGDIELEGMWMIRDSTVEGIPEIVADLTDFLTRTGVDLDSSAEREIDITLGRDGPEGGYELSVTSDRVEIRARDIGGLWAGAVRLEREMGVRRGPFLPLGEIAASPGWRYQISQAPWGSNYLVPDLGPEFLGDDAFRLLAHYGVNGMTIYGDALLYVNSKILPELNHPDFDEHIGVLRDTTERAARYGISLFWVPVLPKLGEGHPVFSSHPEVRGARLGWGERENPLYTLCSTSGKSLAFLEELMSGVFERAPLLGGLILIIGGESFYHCYMRPDLSRVGPGERRTNCPRCSKRPAEDVVAGFVAKVSEAVHSTKPGALVAVWPYSAFIWSESPNQLELIRQLPNDVSLLSEIDKDQLLDKGNYTKRIWDYSVDFTGPSERILAQADACRSRELPILVKTETALGLEAIHMPYVPCMNRLEEKWRNVEGLDPDGALQSWMFFGMWGSRAEELGWWSRWCPDIRGSELLRRIARRDFGEACESVTSAWRLISDAVGHLPCIPPYFVGPWFLGPAHPLPFGEDREPSGNFKAALYFQQEREESLSRVMLNSRSSLLVRELPEDPSEWGFHVKDGREPWPTFISEMEEAVRLSSRALEKMDTAGDTRVTGPDMGRLQEESIAIGFLHRSFVTVLNFLRYNFARDGGGGGEELRAIMIDELRNAEQSRNLYSRAPWLDLALRVDGNFPSSKDMLETKIRLLREELG